MQQPPSTKIVSSEAAVILDDTLVYTDDQRICDLTVRSHKRSTIHLKYNINDALMKVS
jgi:hypothetical protein